jgi:hypothetical protein
MVRELGDIARGCAPEPCDDFNLCAFSFHDAQCVTPPAAASRPPILGQMPVANVVGCTELLKAFPVRVKVV